MNLENQCTSLGISKKLKEFGLDYESLWYWRVIPKVITGGKIISNGYEILSKNNSRSYASAKKCKISAFTVAELGELLPYKINKRAIAEGEQEA